MLLYSLISLFLLYRCSAYDFQFSVCIGFLSVWASRSLIHVPSPGFFFFCWFVMFNFDVIVFGFMLLYFILFYYCPIEAHLLSNEKQKGVGLYRRGGAWRSRGSGNQNQEDMLYEGGKCVFNKRKKWKSFLPMLGSQWILSVSVEILESPMIRSFSQTWMWVAHFLFYMLLVFPFYTISDVTRDFFLKASFRWH